MHSPSTPTRFSHPGVVAVADPDAEYFTPRITPRALRRQVTSSSPAQRYHTWDRCELLDGPPLNPSTGFYYHSLPAPRSKMMIPKPRRLCISPQGVKISMVQRPVSMRATITPSSPPKLSPPSQHHFCPIQHHATMPPSSWHQLSHYGVSSSTQNTETRLIHHPSPIKPRRYKPSETHHHAPSKNTVESVMENNPEEPKSQVDVKAKNVFGQPLLFAALKRVQSPQLPRKNRVEENLRTLLSVEGSVENHRKVATIDGSLYKHPEDLGNITLSPSRTRRSTTPAFKDIHSPPQISMNGCGSLSELDVPVREVKKAPEKQAGLAQMDASATTQNQEHLMNGESKVASICSSEGQNNNKTWSTAEKDSVSHSHREGAIALG
ncbi:uncharacterized protein LOC134453324 [Engraulis encrasicolus]|uniref:uncharacterized protein LOC134453324 n=1 Tax=Engraulis encrasicolus TaxID=184585 RepID=UPI002FD3FA7B